MRSIKQMLSSILCCFGIHSSDEIQTPSDLRTLPSPLSVQLPASTIPHAQGRAGSSNADADALRQIFRSSSSIRGYQTAVQPSDLRPKKQSPFDVDFRSGCRAPDRKQPSRLEQLGSHIKQKLSESRLSKSSSKPHIDSEGGPRTSAGTDDPPSRTAVVEAGLSQRSTGLLDLLVSRTGSEGGYDSDARSIQTNMLKSSDATIGPGPRNAQKTSQTPKIPVFAADGAPPSTPRSQDHVEPINIGSYINRLPSTPSKTSFTQFLLADQDNSPTHVLQRLSVGISNGTIKLPDAAEVETISIPAVTETNEKEIAVTPPPKFFDRLDDRNADVIRVLKRLSDTVSAVKRESLVSNIENPRASLVSNLDPNLIDYITRFGEQDSTDLVYTPLHEHADEHAAEVRAKSKSAVVDCSDPFVSPMLVKIESSRKDLSSLAESDQTSVHLYNMRISQRLASPSFVAATSRPNTSHTKTSMDGWHATSQDSLADRYPTFIAVEHNRRPSDPRTRRLFEGNKITERGRSQWQAPVQTDSASTARYPKHVGNNDDTSSFYGNDGGVDDIETIKSWAVRKNANSLAIGGRSESISFPIDPNVSMSHFSVAEEGTWFSRKSSHQQQQQQQQRAPDAESQLHRGTQRNRSVSVPEETMSRPAIMRPLVRKQPRNTSEANEVLSVIYTSHLQDSRRNHHMEMSLEAEREARHERMSEIEYLETSDISINKQGSRNRNSSTLSTGRRSLGTPGPSLEYRHRLEDEMAARPGCNEIGKLQESATNMWRKSFKRATEEPQEVSLGGFLTSPKFDRHGRQRSTISSYSTVQSPNSDSDNRKSVVTRQQAQSESSALKVTPHVQVSLKESDQLLKANRMKSRAVVDGRTERSVRLGDKKTSKKKSLLDMGRRFTVIGGSPEHDRGSGTNTPLKDLFGLSGRFPSHTREERGASAGANDGVVARDFALEHQDENSPGWTTPPNPLSRSTVALGLRTPGSWRVLPFGKNARIDKAKSNSMTLPQTLQQTESLGLRAKKSRKGLAGRWKKLYRSNSSDFRAYMHTHGHRSSISLGASVEYPELEVVPVEGGLSDYKTLDWRPEFDGTADPEHGHQGVAATQFQDAVRVGLPPLDMQPWTRMYRDCVGSLSALKSDPELGGKDLDRGASPQDGQRPVACSAGGIELRSSTVDFEAQLGKEHEEVKEGLMRKIENMGQDGQEQFDDLKGKGKENQA